MQLYHLPLGQATYFTHVYASQLSSQYDCKRVEGEGMWYPNVYKGGTDETNTSERQRISQTAMWVGLKLAQRRDCSTDVGPTYVAVWVTPCLSDQSSDAKETVVLSCTSSFEYCSTNNVIAPQLWLANRLSRCPLWGTHCKATFKRWTRVLIKALFITHSTTGL